jgi:hypothetical protein
MDRWLKKVTLQKKKENIKQDELQVSPVLRTFDLTNFRHNDESYFLPFFSLKNTSFSVQ